MILWRISKHKALTGEGGLYASGRWHHKGVPVIYCSESPAGAMLEILVHIEIDSIDNLPEDLLLLEVELLTKSRIKKMPSDRPIRELPIRESRAIGSQWLKESKAPVLEVPSVIMPKSKNFLINPKYENLQLRVKASYGINFDQRLFSF